VGDMADGGVVASSETGDGGGGWGYDNALVTPSFFSFLLPQFVTSRQKMRRIMRAPPQMIGGNYSH